MTHYKIFLPKNAAEKRLVIDETLDKKLRKRLADHFEGYTKYQAKGGWKNDGELIEENVFVYETIVNNSKNGVIKGIGKWLLHETNESMILISIDGKPVTFE